MYLPVPGFEPPLLYMSLAFDFFPFLLYGSVVSESVRRWRLSAINLLITLLRLHSFNIIYEKLAQNWQNI